MFRESSHLPLVLAHGALKFDIYWSLWTLIALMFPQPTARETSTAVVATLHQRPPTLFSLVLLQVAQLALPLAAIPLPRAADLQIQHFPLLISVQQRVERLIAEWTWFISCFDVIDTRLADFGTAAAEQMGIAERQEADGTNEGAWRRVYEIAVVSSFGHIENRSLHPVVLRQPPPALQF